MRKSFIFSKSTSLFLILLVLFFGETSLTLAATWQRLDLQNNVIHVLGSCANKKEVTVYLLSATTSDVIYAAGAPCDKGNFNFTDELTRWGIPTGTYHLVVGEGQGLANLNHTEDLSVVYPTYEPGLPPDPNTIFENRAGSIVTNLQAMSESVASMIQTLGDTSYSAVLKVALSGFLGSIEVTLTGLADVVLHMQNLIYGIEQTFYSLPSSTPADTPFVPAVTSSGDTNSTTPSLDSTSTDQTEDTTTIEVAPANEPPDTTTPPESEPIVLDISTTTPSATEPAQPTTEASSTVTSEPIPDQ